MTLQVGSIFPNVEFYDPNAENDTNSTHKLFAGKKVILLFVPGAFTPTCHGKHLPDFQENFQHLQTVYKIDHVVVVSTNDYHVMEGWKRDFKDLTMLPDTLRELARQCGLLQEIPQEKHLRLGAEPRTNRAAVIVNNLKVTAAFVEKGMGDVKLSRYENVVKILVMQGI